MSRSTQAVRYPVQATLTPIRLRVAEAERVLRGGWQEPDYDERPWAVLGSCHVTFHFGRFVTSKTITGRVQFLQHEERPTDAEIAAAEAKVIDQIVDRLDAHGLDGGLLPVERTDGEP